MKRSVVLTLTDEELMELVRIITGDDSDGALEFLKKHVGKKAWAVLEGKGHCRPWFEVFGGSPIPEEFREKGSERE